MPLSPSTRLGPYEIIAPLGAGGMGEVYRARDTRLNRDVAVKVLPQHLTSNPEVRARFEREAKTVSGLNHPHICTLHDVGREGDTDYLVMELIEGETLAQLIAKGALPTSEVLRLGAQIADALDRAHRAGVIHRDLKPGNIMLTRSGAKLMDFGLARSTGLPGGTGSGVSMAAMTQSPTVAAPLTAEGTILGTFQYMSPEQLEGREADARADLWALGCVLYEMATGQRPFEGRSQASLISSIMSSEPPPVTQLAPTSSPALDQLVRGLLAKDPDERVQTAHDVRLQLQWIAGSGSQSGAPAISVQRGLRIAPVAWALIAVVAVLAFAAGTWLASRSSPADVTALRLNAPMPPGLTMSTAGGDFALSPDGSAMLFVANDSLGVAKLWVRPLDGRPAASLPGTEDGFMPFWSPDGKSVGFFAGGKLRKVAIAGGTPEDLCVAAGGRGGSWGAGDVILYAPGPDHPIFRISAQGGTPVAVTALDTTEHELGHRFPRFLPDGKHFFFATTPVVGKEHEIFLSQVGSTARKFVLRSDGVPEFTREGWLLFHHNGLIYAQCFDPGSARLSGEAKPMFPASQGQGYQAAPFTWTGSNGLLACTLELQVDARLTWVDRTGRTEPIAGLSPAFWLAPALSHDGTHLALERGSAQNTNATGFAIWMSDPARGGANPLTFGPGIDINPIWSPDDRTIAFSSNRSGNYAIYTRSATGSAEPQLLASSKYYVMNVTDWSPDGRFLIYEVEDAKTSRDIWEVSTDAGHVMKPLLNSSFSELGGVLSPDGRWLSYTSDESGRFEVYVQSFPALEGKTQVSVGGGSGSRWSRDGRELFYRSLDGSMMAAKVKLSPAFHAEPPVRLFNLPGIENGFCVAPDGRRFLIALSAQDPAHGAPMVVVHWTAMLKEK